MSDDVTGGSPGSQALPSTRDIVGFFFPAWPHNARSLSTLTEALVNRILRETSIKRILRLGVHYDCGLTINFFASVIYSLTKQFTVPQSFINIPFSPFIISLYKFLPLPRIIAIAIEENNIISKCMIVCIIRGFNETFVAFREKNMCIIIVV